MFVVVPAILGITAAAILAVTACFCVRRFRQQQTKKAGAEAGLPFQPARRPTAVRSPSGQPSHYLKKSPSPNGSKPLPGTLLTPTAESLPPTPHTQPQQPTPHQHPTIRYTEENEHHHPSNGGLDMSEMSADMTDSSHGVTEEMYGKLGTLVFKLRYLVERNALVVSVVRCRGLPGKQSLVGSLGSTGAGGGGELINGANGKTHLATDPYVKLQLLPEKQHKVKTRCVNSNVLRKRKNDLLM